MHQHPDEPLKGVDWIKMYIDFWEPLKGLHSGLSKLDSPKVTVDDLLVLSEFLKREGDDPPVPKWIEFSEFTAKKVKSNCCLLKCVHR